MKEKPNYYAIIPADVRYDEDLKSNAKLLYGEITALCDKKGYCYATNKYFADLYKVSKISISNWISQLVEKGYISNEIVYKEGSKEIFNRYLKILKYPIKENFNTPIKENFNKNNTSINNTSINKKEIYKERKFKKPTLEEVKEYCLERNNDVDAEQFIDYYETNGWVQGKGKPIKNWKACVRTWERNSKKTSDREKRIEEWLKDE